MTNLIDFFKSQAKFLQKDFNKHKFEAICRFDNVFINKEEPTLMNFQHVIAKESGFNNWNELKNATGNELKVAHILYKNIGLNASGIRFNLQAMRKMNKIEKQQYRTESRRVLLDNSDFIIKVSELLSKSIMPTSTIRNTHSSYKIKHIVERSLSSFNIEGTYVSNGELIIAASIAGFKFTPCSPYEGLSVYFNMQKKSLMALPGYRS